MSRIGRQPVPVPPGVQVTARGNTVEVSGPKGALERTFHPDMSIAVVGDEVVVARPSDERQHKALHGLTRALINNMVIGVSQGFSKVLQVVGVGYRASLQGERLVLQLGHSHAIEVIPPSDVSFTVGARSAVDRNIVATITVEGIDKQVVGQVAADIRSWRPPEPYKGKGVRYEGEYVRRKAGKAGKIA